MVGLRKTKQKKNKKKKTKPGKILLQAGTITACKDYHLNDLHIVLT
jgi:hypothetical protein